MGPKFLFTHFCMEPEIFKMKELGTYLASPQWCFGHDKAHIYK